MGTKAPGITNTGTDDYIAAHNLLRAHAKAYRLYESKYRPTQQGISYLMVDLVENQLGSIRVDFQVRLVLP